jgi:hypothetical protein
MSVRGTYEHEKTMRKLGISPSARLPGMLNNPSVIDWFVKTFYIKGPLDRLFGEHQEKPTATTSHRATILGKSVDIRHEQPFINQRLRERQLRWKNKRLRDW